MTLQAQPPFGALQISAHKKEHGTVSDEDLIEFAGVSPQNSADIRRVSCGSFVGIARQSLRGKTFWDEWWLRSGTLMLYVTYNVVADQQNAETATIAQILDTLVVNL